MAIQRHWRMTCRRIACWHGLRRALGWLWICVQRHTLRGAFFTDQMQVPTMRVRCRRGSIPVARE